MADPPLFSLFQRRFLTGDNPFLKIDDEFLRRHTKVLLRSDASERIWKVKLDGDRLADGWEEFAGDSKFRDGDVLVFRHDGDENFHVSVSSRSSDIEHASSSYVDTEDGYINDEDVESDDDDYDEDGGNISLMMKKKKPEAGSSSGHSCFVKARVTRYSLLKDRLDLSRTFTVSFGGQNKTHEIDLVNEKGRRWTLLLAKNISSGVFYIRRGWTNFCSANELSQGDLCKFKLVENGEKPVLWLCPQESGNDHEEEEVDAVKNCSAGGGCSNGKSKSDGVSEGKKKKKTPSPFLTTKLTPSRYKTGQLYISSRFIAENGINKLGEITLLNKDGRKWSSNLQMTGCEKKGSEWFYLRRGWIEMCKANGVKVNDSFVLELIWEDANPMFRFHSKIESQGKGNRRTRKKRACETDLQARTVEKTPRVEKEGRTRVSNRQESCSVSDQVTNAKQSIVDTLNTVREFRADLETRERDLEASLVEIDVLGERILGISQILNNKLI